MNLEGVTICVTYHNEPRETLHRAWQSVVKQTLCPYELLIIDDGSDPPLSEWSQAARFSTRLIGITNRGLPAARNTGLMLCKTEAILFLDADDWLDPTYLEKTLPLLKGADVVLTGLQEHGPTRNGTYMPGYDKPYDQVSLEDMIAMNRFYYCSLLRTSLMRECGGYNPLMAGPYNQGGGYEDHDMWVDLMKRGARFAAVQEPLFHYDTTSTSSMVHRAALNREALHAEMRRHHGIT